MERPPLLFDQSGDRRPARSAIRPGAEHGADLGDARQPAIGAVTRVAQRQSGFRAGSPWTIMNPRQSTGCGSTRAGVALNPGWPDIVSVSGQANLPVRPPVDCWSVQWIGVNTSPGRWLSL